MYKDTLFCCINGTIKYHSAPCFSHLTVSMLNEKLTIFYGEINYVTTINCFLVTDISPFFFQFFSITNSACICVYKCECFFGIDE